MPLPPALSCPISDSQTQLAATGKPGESLTQWLKPVQSPACELADPPTPATPRATSDAKAAPKRRKLADDHERDAFRRLFYPKSA